MSLYPHESQAVEQLELHVYLSDGTLSRYTQREPNLAAGILNGIHPARFFSQRQFVVGTPSALTAYTISQIVRLDIVMAGFPNWPFVGQVNDMREISGEEFDARFRRAYDGSAPSQAAENDEFLAVAETPAELALVGELGMIGGIRTLMEVHSTVTARVDRELVIQQLFNAPVHFCRRMGGGVSMFNPAHVLFYRFMPGFAELPQYAIPAMQLSLPNKRREISEQDLTG